MKIEALQILCPGAPWYKCGDTWGIHKLPEGYEKPSKKHSRPSSRTHRRTTPQKTPRRAGRLLSQTDKYATIDFPHGSEAAKQAWLDYRPGAP